MSYSTELDTLAADTVEMLSDVQAVLYLVTLGAFSTTTMKNTVTTAPGVDVDCVRGATICYETPINGKPTKVKDTTWIIKASGLSRAPQENDKLTLGGVTYPVVHATAEVAGRQYRLTTRELG